MRVRAVRKGQKPDRRWAEPGDVFDYDGPKLAAWMELVDGGEAPKAKDKDKKIIQTANLDAADESEAVGVLSEPEPPAKRKVGRPKKDAS